MYFLTLPHPHSNKTFYFPVIAPKPKSNHHVCVCVFPYREHSLPSKTYKERSRAVKRVKFVFLVSSWPDPGNRRRWLLPKRAWEERERSKTQRVNDEKKSNRRGGPYDFITTTMQLLLNARACVHACVFREEVCVTASSPPSGQLIFADNNCGGVWRHEGSRSKITRDCLPGTRIAFCRFHVLRAHWKSSNCIDETVEPEPDDYHLRAIITQ